MSFHPPPGISSAIARWALAALLWLLRRPFLFSRRLWVASLTATVLVDVLAWIFGPSALALALISLSILCAAVLVQWWRLGRGDHPIVYVSLFRGRSQIGRAAAETHLGALAAYLRESEVLADVGQLDIRTIDLPLSEAQAERLLRISNALLVIRGTGDAAVDSSRWEWWAHFRDRLPDFMLAEDRFSVIHTDSRRSFLDRLLTVPAVATTHSVEGDVDLAAFVSTSIRVRHFNSLSKVIGILASELAFEGALPGHLFLIPEPDDPDLGPGLQGRSAMLEAISRISTGGDLLAVLDHLQRLCVSGVGDADFAHWVELQWFTARIEERRTPQESLAAVMAIVERFPEDVTGLVNVAGEAVVAGELDRAEDLADQAARVNPGDFGVTRIHGNIAWSRGEPARALAFYREALQEGSPLSRQIGDCLRALGEPDSALHCYRDALRRNSASGHATRQARDLLGIPRLVPTIPDDWHRSLWRTLHRLPRLSRPLLRFWRSRRPEDPWLEVFLGRHALVVGDLAAAEEWSGLAMRFAHTNQSIAMLNLLAIAFLEERPDLETGARVLREHLEWLGANGIPSPVEEATAALGLLLVSVRRRAKRLRSQDFQSLMADAGLIG
jgi:tetratricopeptide (TPR) repeat protein